MKLYREFDTLIIGGGQAGLSVSYQLKLEGRDHIVLEQAAQPANTWRNHRWDSFTLNNPNWQSQLQGARIPGKHPDGFLTRDELVSYFEEYIQQNRLPLRYQTLVFTVKSVTDGYAVETSAGTFRARNVVVATGICQKPSIPRFKGALSPDLRQLHSDSYRNPDSLPAGAVLVVGSAQSGAQIAEELYQSGRSVYLNAVRDKYCAYMRSIGQTGSRELWRIAGDGRAAGKEWPWKTYGLHRNLPMAGASKHLSGKRA
jgi:putative flavoprotein involved in K+ transport